MPDSHSLIGPTVSHYRILRHPFPTRSHRLARASRLAGDPAKARSAYQDFLALWKSANPDLPILKQAQSEYASRH